MEINNFTLQIFWLVLFSLCIEFILGWIGVFFHNVGLICGFGAITLYLYFQEFHKINKRMRILERVKSSDFPAEIYEKIKKARRNYFLQIGCLATFAEVICKLDTFFVNKIIENPIHVSITFGVLISSVLPILFALWAFFKGNVMAKPKSSGRFTWFFTDLAFVSSFCTLLAGVYGGVAFQAAENIFRFSWGDWWLLSSYRTDATRTLSLIFGSIGFVFFLVLVPIGLSISDVIEFKREFRTEKEESPLLPIATKIAMQLYVVYMAICVITGINLVPDFFTSHLNKVEKQTFSLEQNFNNCLNNKGGESCYKKMATELKSARNLEETEILSNVTSHVQKVNFQKEKSQADTLRNSHLALLNKEFINRSDKNIILLQEQIRYEKQRIKEIFYKWIRCNPSRSPSSQTGNQGIRVFCEAKSE